MAESCCAPSCCGGSGPVPDDYPYPEQPYVVGSVDTFAGPIPLVTTELTSADRLGALGVRLDFRRSDYRVRPGLYAIGDPTDEAPVLVTANYKLTFDALRSAMSGRDAWVLVLNTRGVNVWCAAGKKTFGSFELIARIADAQLAQVVSHRTVIAPQLGATGVSARAVHAASGFRVVWGPVRAGDIPAYLEAGMKATAEMRRVTFGMTERAKLVAVELSFLWRPKTLLALAAAAASVAAWAALAPAAVPWDVIAAVASALLIGFVAGVVITPVLLPWIPGRAFALKGAIAGALFAGVVAVGAFPVLGVAGSIAVVALAAAVSSFAAMNFTGSSTYTSPSGVEHEMRRAIPFQGAALLAGIVASVLAAVIA